MDRSENMTVIGPDTLIRGEITIPTAAKIYGRVEGKVIAQGQVQIGAGAECKASVEASQATIDGTVDGNVLVHEKLELTTTAVVRGDIVAAKLIVAEGASFSGHCSVGVEAVQAAKAEQMAEQNARNKAPKLTSAVTTGSDLDSTIAGLEAKLAGFGKARMGAEA